MALPAEGETLTSRRGSYAVVRIVGQGAYGAVFEANGPFDQRFALKVLVPNNQSYAELVQQWQREAGRLLALRHPGVVYMHDAFESQHRFVIALEWCEMSLRDLMSRPLEAPVAIELTRQILAAVQYLHDNDLVHTDLHPGNVLLTDPDRLVVKIADFGIAQELHGRGVAWPGVVHHAIMAPEVVAGGYTSRQSDLYQIGLLLFWMITGEAPLDVRAPYPELLRQISDGIPRQRAEALGTPIGKVIARLLRRREAYRFASAREVWDELRALRSPVI
jgi:serine/threonine-protein kinase